MKNFLFLILLFFVTPLFAQNVSGLYSGILHNDSAKQIQKYELALSEYRGKITGYAYATFIANDTFYYSIRRVHATREKDQLMVEDDEMVANNFPRRPDKGVHRISYIPLNHDADTLRNFSGNWKTTQTKKFYSAPGTMEMKRDNDSAHSALVAQLRELNILAPEYKMVEQPDEKAQPVIVKKDVPTKTETVAVTKPTTTSTKHEDLKKLNSPAAKPTTATAVTTTTALLYTERKKPAPQIFDVHSDSLTLSFYDNGIVDGDVISVYVNGENVISNTKLLEVATKKTIHLPATADSVELLLVAETLGSIPPNTGLLVVQDGDARYEVRFSADLQTNAAIVFRKRK